MALLEELRIADFLPEEFWLEYGAIVTAYERVR